MPASKLLSAFNILHQKGEYLHQIQIAQTITTPPKHLRVVERELEWEAICKYICQDVGGEVT